MWYLLQTFKTHISMKHRWLFFLLVFFIPLFSMAQEEDIKAKSQTAEFGVTDLDLIDAMMITVPGIGRDPRDIIERQSIKPYMMPVRRVGARSGELSYALASCLEYYVNLNKNYKDNLSPDFIALSLENAGQRTTVSEAFRFLAEQGTISASIMPYDASTIPNAVHATNKYRINNYLYIFRDVMKGRQKIFEARKALMRGNPVIVELQADASIRNLLHHTTFEPGKESKQLFPLIVVGYDEGMEAFEVMSSWGSSWGNGGYMWIMYDDFEKYAINGYVMVPLPSY